MAHKDLKPENILLDKNFDLKLADFGLSGSIEGSSGSGLERTSFVGTPGYMAPEIHMNIPYQGQVVDLFALGVTIFIMHTGTFPFKEARITDPYYKHIAARDYNSFWQMHESLHERKDVGGKKEVVFSESFKDLISGMLAFQPF